MPYIQTPKGTYAQVPEGLSDEEAVAFAKQKHPLAFVDPSKAEEGFAPNLMSGIGTLASKWGIAGSAALGASDPKLRRDIEAMQAQSAQTAKSPSWTDVKKAYEEGPLFGTAGNWGAAGKALEFARDTTAQSLPSMAPIFAGGAAGAAAGSIAGPAGTVLGGLVGATAVGIPEMFGGNLETQAESKAPLDRTAALAAAVPQSMLNTAEQYFVLGGRLGLGKKFAQALTKAPPEIAEKALLAKSQRALATTAEKGTLRTLAEGAATGAAVEVPTEIAQQVLERAQAGKALLDADAMNEYEATAAGVLGPGFVFGGFGGLSKRSEARGELAGQKAVADRAAEDVRLKAEEAKKLADEAATKTPEYIQQQAAKAEELAKQAEPLTTLLARKDLPKDVRAEANRRRNELLAEIKRLTPAGQVTVSPEGTLDDMLRKQEEERVADEAERIKAEQEAAAEPLRRLQEEAAAREAAAAARAAQYETAGRPTTAAGQFAFPTAADARIAEQAHASAASTLGAGAFPFPTSADAQAAQIEAGHVPEVVPPAETTPDKQLEAQIKYAAPVVEKQQAAEAVRDEATTLQREKLELQQSIGKGAAFLAGTSVRPEVRAVVEQHTAEDTARIAAIDAQLKKLKFKVPEAVDSPPPVEPPPTETEAQLLDAAVPEPAAAFKVAPVEGKQAALTVASYNTKKRDAALNGFAETIDALRKSDYSDVSQAELLKQAGRHRADYIDAMLHEAAYLRQVKDRNALTNDEALKASERVFTRLTELIDKATGRTPTRQPITPMSMAYAKALAPLYAKAHAALKAKDRPAFEAARDEINNVLPKSDAIERGMTISEGRIPKTGAEAEVPRAGRAAIETPQQLMQAYSKFKKAQKIGGAPETELSGLRNELGRVSYELAAPEMPAKRVVPITEEEKNNRPPLRLVKSPAETAVKATQEEAPVKDTHTLDMFVEAEKKRVAERTAEELAASGDAQKVREAIEEAKRALRNVEEEATASVRASPVGKNLLSRIKGLPKDSKVVSRLQGTLEGLITAKVANLKDFYESGITKAERRLEVLGHELANKKEVHAPKRGVLAQRRADVEAKYAAEVDAAKEALAKRMAKLEKLGAEVPTDKKKAMAAAAEKPLKAVIAKINAESAPINTAIERAEKRNKTLADKKLLAEEKARAVAEARAKVRAERATRLHQKLTAEKKVPTPKSDTLDKFSAATEKARAAPTSTITTATTQLQDAEETRKSRAGELKAEKARLNAEIKEVLRKIVAAPDASPEKAALRRQHEALKAEKRDLKDSMPVARRLAITRETPGAEKVRTKPDLEHAQRANVGKAFKNLLVQYDRLLGEQAKAAEAGKKVPAAIVQKEKGLRAAYHALKQRANTYEIDLPSLEEGHEKAVTAAKLEKTAVGVDNRPTSSRKAPLVHRASVEEVAQRAPGRRGYTGEEVTDAERQAEEDAEGDETSFSRVEALPEKAGRMSTEQTQSVVDAVTSKWENAPPVKVLSSFSDAPQAVQDKAAAEKSDKPPAAFFHRGTVYVVADAHATPNGVVESMFHESLGHYGLRGVFGSRLDGVLRAVDKAMPDAVTEKAKAYGVDHAVQENRMAMAEELLSELAQRSPKLGLVQRFVAMVRGLVRQLMPSLRLSENDIIHNFITPARDFVRNKQQGVAMPAGATAFHRAAATVELPSEFSKLIDRNIVKTNPTIVSKFKDWVTGFSPGVKLDSPVAWETAFVDAKAAALRAIRGTGNAIQAQYYMRVAERDYNVTSQVATVGPLALVKDSKGRNTIEAQKGGPNLVKIAQDLNESGLGEKASGAFTMYMAIMRSRNAGIGFDKLNFDPAIFSEKQAKDFVKWVEAPENKQVLDSFEKARRRYNEYNGKMVDFLVTAGRITQAQADELKAKKDYVPYYRTDPKTGVVEMMLGDEGFLRIGDLKNQPHLNQLVGGNEPIFDIMHSALQNTSLLTHMALSNLATKETVFALRDAGMLEGPVGKDGTLHYIRAGRGPDSPTTLRFFQNKDVENAKGEDKGNAWHVVVKDSPEVPAALVVKGMEGISTMVPKALQLLGAPAKLLRNAVILSPAYPVRQLFRDSFSAAGTAGTNAIPLIAPLKRLSAMMQDMSPTEHSLQAQGVLGGQVMTGTPEDMAVILRQMSAGGPDGVGLLAKMESMSMKADASVRVAAYDSYVKQGLSHMEASLQAMEMANFNKRGMSPSIHMLNQLVPFFNAQIQGLSVLAKAMRGNMPFEEQLKIKQKFYTRGLMMAATTAAYFAMLHDDDQYKKASLRDRFNNFFVKIPGQEESVRIPIPFEFGLIFKAIPEAMFNVVAMKEDGAKVFKEIADMAMQQVPGGTSWGLPTAVSPMIQTVTGYNLFTGKDLLSAHEAQLDPSSQYREGTTEFSKMLGQTNLISPIKSDFFIQQQFGAVGLAMVATLNAVLGEKGPAGTGGITKLPLLGGSFQPADGGKIVGDVYDTLNDAAKAPATLKDLASKDMDKAEEFVRNNQERLALAQMAPQFRANMLGFTQEIQELQRNRDLTNAQKQKELERIKEERSSVAEQYRVAIKQVKQANAAR